MNTTNAVNDEQGTQDDQTIWDFLVFIAVATGYADTQRAERVWSDCLEQRSKRPKSTPKKRDAAKAARDKADADYIAWSDRQDDTARKMIKDGFWPFTGGVGQPIFLQDGQAVEAGAERLHSYDAQDTHQILIRTARAFEEQGGYKLPATFLLEAAQMFYQEGELCEVRLSGYDMRPQPQPDENGQPVFKQWQTNNAPQVKAKGADLEVAPDPQKRPQMAALNETAQAILTLERDYYARLKTGGKAQEPNNVLRLLVAWNTQGDISAPPKSTSSRATRLNELPQTLRFTNDNVHSAMIRGFALVSEWSEGDDYHRGITQNFKNLKITLSLPNGEKAESLWAFLSKGGPAMIKAHYALWARYFEEAQDGLAVQYIAVDINKFCSDLGYSKYKGSFRTRDKRQAMQLLEGLTAVEMSATYHDKRDKKLRRLRGPIWARGMIAEEADTYEDLFGAAREGSSELWTPRSFSYAPGPFHADEDWRRYNEFVGKIGVGLMRLDNRTDEWAILIGGYLGTLARTNGYVPKRLNIGNVLKAVGLAQSPNAKREPTKYREKLLAALDKLKEIGVIAKWEIDKVNINDPAEDDPDNPAAWADYAQEAIYPPGDWRGWIVLITFPQEGDRVRLKEQKSKAIAQTKRRRAPAKRAAQEE